MKTEEPIERSSIDLYNLFLPAEGAFYEYYNQMKIVFDLENQEEKSNSIIKRRTQNLRAIVFTFIFLEALIYDYCATFTSDNFVKKYIDKLDFISKWVLIPKFVSGSQFPTDSQSFEYLQRLKKERNDLMHFKNEYQIFVDNFFKEIRRKL